jgi:general stress protein 26
MLDPVIRDLAHGKNFGSISFHLPNGAIATHVMWVDADDDRLLINTEVHRAKYKAIVANPSVTVAIWSTDNAYKYAEVRGTFTGEIRGPAARAHIDFLSQKYTSEDYQGEIASERVILQITPVRQRSHGL